MTSRFESREAVSGKADWEGGVAEAVEYGITADQMPEGDTALAEAWKGGEEACAALSEREQAIQKLLDEEPQGAGHADPE